MWENYLSFNVLAGGCKEIEIGEFIKQTFTSATDSELSTQYCQNI